ncbi:hypothetical protein CQA66_07115 [Helicobacter aurati]|uniref:Outer membrane beta-barrel protein n=1 Tax=Helicobacter aurati TaxID=137778 RepID=A0A3D8J0N9_9HELI|nr:hypothetical protein [Helicobacter aurati]RDU71058.1 hypothetical protein CQA66_07115 [Helicobacter aurati]
MNTYLNKIAKLFFIILSSGFLHAQINQTGHRTSQYNIGWGLVYGFDWRKSNLGHTTANYQTSGIDNQYGVIASIQYILESQFFYEIPLIISYVAPSARYFQAYYNNTGDGYHFDMSLMGGYYLFHTQNLKLSFKGGFGYGFGYIWQTRFRLTANSSIEDTSSVAHNTLIARIGTEVGYLKHYLGMLVNYYMWSGEFAELYSQPNQTSTTIPAPLVVNTSNHYANSFGINLYYMYRF